MSKRVPVQQKDSKVKNREQALSSFAFILSRKVWESLREKNLGPDYIEDELASGPIIKLTEFLMDRFFSELTVEEALAFFSPEDSITPEHWEALCFKSMKTIIRVLALESATLKVIDRARIIVERWFEEGPSLRIYDNDGRTQQLGPTTVSIVRTMIANISLLN